jgi:hypothetical protein
MKDRVREKEVESVRAKKKKGHRVLNTALNF